jgi:hypothetical protein
MDQRQLEAWIKASRQELLPQGANDYLFGGLGEWPTVRLVTAQRRVVVSAASGGILALGLLLMYVPWLRSAGVLASAAVVLAAVAVLVPDVALLGAQGGVLGVVVMIVALGWIWITSGRATISAPASNPLSVSRREGSSLHGSARVRERSSRITTTAGPGPLMEARP